jgi:hypothetical protein
VAAIVGRRWTAAGTRKRAASANLEKALVFFLEPHFCGVAFCNRNLSTTSFAAPMAPGLQRRETGGKPCCQRDGKAAQTQADEEISLVGGRISGFRYVKKEFPLPPLNPCDQTHVQAFFFL